MENQAEWGADRNRLSWAPSHHRVSPINGLSISGSPRNDEPLRAPRPATSAEYLHRFAEVTKHAFWTRLRYAGDPDVIPPPLDRLLEWRGYWSKEVAEIDPDRAKPFENPGKARRPGQPYTDFVVADRWGNVVSATQTLGNSFGSRIMPEGTGIWLNNSLAYCTFEPKGNPMDAFPGRHKLSGDCPTLILRDGKLWVALGTPGGHTNSRNRCPK